MMMSSCSRLSRAIIGLGFGDEGKGKKVHRLTEKWSDSVVVRYSGGQQAGHTVYYNKTTGHVFANFGAGSFNGVPTYWSKYCTFDPVGVIRELSVLKDLNLNPTLYVDLNCPVTTPFEKKYNQNTFDYLRNGTCGVGVGQTYEREEKFYHLQVRDLLFPSVHKIKLGNIGDWYGLLQCHDIRNAAVSDIPTYNEACEMLLKSDNIQFVDGLNSLPPELKNNQIIFEGSQGLLLDQHIGFFPHVTRSNVGSKNILALCEEYNIEPPRLELMTRAYQTRHGAGPMTNFDKPLVLSSTQWETNKPNRWQGEFRATLLDIDLLKYAIEKDEYIKRAEHKHINVTCLDQMEELKCTMDGETKEFSDVEGFLNFISEATGIEARPETGP